MPTNCSISNKTTEHKVKAILEAHPGKPIQAFHTALMSGSDDAADVAVAIALDPLCGINRRSTTADRALTFIFSDFQLISDLGGSTPLTVAAYADALSVAERLLESGADVNASEKRYGFTALHVAGSIEMAALLLRYNADPNACDGETGYTPLHFVCHSKRSEIIPLLIAEGVDVNARLPKLFNISPLHIAAWSGHVPSLTALLSADANTTLLDEAGNTPLHQAVVNSHVEAASVLASHPGTPLNAVNNHDWSALDVACKSEQPSTSATHIVDVLLGHGCAVSNYKSTPLHDAANADVFQKLLDNGSDINSLTGDGGMSPLHYAAWRGCPTTVSLLVAEGADLEAADSAGCTALHTAVIHQNHGMLVSLLSLGANVHAINKEGQTPLHIAAQKMLIDTIESLVLQGCNVHFRDKKGQSALDVFEEAFRPRAFYSTSRPKPAPPPSDVVDRIRQVLATERTVRRQCTVS